MSEVQILEQLKSAVVETDKDKAVRAAEALVAQGLDPVEGIERGLAPGAVRIGEMFDEGECFLPELILASDAFTAATKVLEAEIMRRGEARERRGVVVIGTVKGDIHKIGKDIVAMLMRVRGFEVHDLGEDVSMSTFVEKAETHGADIIAMSSLLTTTMPAQREVIELLEETNVRDRYRVLVGGSPVTQAWADRIGADGYADTAPAAVERALELISVNA
jgi:trimethylamine corrinoid protein